MTPEVTPEPPEVLFGREVPLGGVRQLSVSRSLPQHRRRTIGAWCFVDHYGPVEQGATAMDVPPHPHTGLQTVSWLLSGEVHHLDSAGGDLLVRPGELVLMTSGHGIAHSEQSAGSGSPVLHGTQLWIALPDVVRQQSPRLQHVVDPPVIRAGGAAVTVIVGSYGGRVSPAIVHTPLVGLDVVLDGELDLQLRPDFEHGVLLMAGDARVEGVDTERGSLLYLGPGRGSTRLTGGGRLLVIGGEPFDEELVMWWNFVGRSHDDIAIARAEWEAGADRFGSVTGYPGDRLAAPPLPNVRLRPRPRVPAT